MAFSGTGIKSFVLEGALGELQVLAFDPEPEQGCAATSMLEQHLIGIQLHVTSMSVP